MVTPQPRAGPSRNNAEQRQNRLRQGRRVSCAKQDQLHTEGKCFQRKQTGHSQRDSPELNTMRPPMVRMNTVKVMWLEHLSRARDRADLQVGCVLLNLDESEDNTMPVIRRAYEQCTSKWGSNAHWLDPESRWESKYGIYQYGTGHGDLVQVLVRDLPEFGPLEIDVERFEDPEFDLTDMYNTSANTGSCVQEGGFQDCKHYNRSKWSAMEWLRDLANEQSKSDEIADKVVMVQLSLKGYQVNIVGTNRHYEITHAELLGDALNIGNILNVTRAAKEVDTGDCPNIFRDTSLNKKQDITLHVTKLTAGTTRQCRCTSGMEGVSSIEKTLMRVKDHSQKVPEPIVVLNWNDLQWSV